MTNLIVQSGTYFVRAFTGARRYQWVVLTGFLLSACVETGDFGRRKPSIFDGNRSIDLAPELTSSSYSLTDDEKELRQRAFIYLAAPRAPAWPTPIPIDTLLAESFETYYDRLAGLPDRSPSARYQRLLSDIEADRSNLAPFRAIACRVAAADRHRRGLLDKTVLPDLERSDFLIRMTDNKNLAIAVEDHVSARLAIYEKSLTRLRLQSPDTNETSVSDALYALRKAQQVKSNCRFD